MPAKTDETTEVPQDVKDAAAASVAKVNEKRAEGEVEPNAPRTRRGARDRELYVSDIPSPLAEDLSDYGPTGFAAHFEGLDITGEMDTQEFFVDSNRATNLTFQAPGQNLPKKRLYTIKAFHKDGRLVQLGFEQQIQNNAGGDPEDAIGLRRYQRKGIKLLFDFETFMPTYCAAWGCWAPAMTTKWAEQYPQFRDAINSGFCSTRHAQHTLPNTYRDAGQILSGLGINATTTNTWSV